MKGRALQLLIALTAAWTLHLGVAAASPRVLVYRGKLGSHGAIQIDTRGASASVYFSAQCVGLGPAHTKFEPDTEPDEFSVLREPQYEAVHVRLHRGRLSVAARVREQPPHGPGQPPAPEALIDVNARVTPTQVSGIFSLSLFEPLRPPEPKPKPGGGVTNPGGIERSGEERCSTGEVKFAIRRATRRPKEHNECNYNVEPRCILAKLH